MKLLANHFSKFHIFTTIGFAVVFSALTFWAMIEQSPSDWRENKNIAATACAVVSGPFTGAIARPTQSDCLKFGFKLLPYCGVFLLVGLLSQFITLPFGRAAAIIRKTIWVLGLLGWHAGTILSLLFALS